MGATVTRAGALSVQVCVPKEWTDDQVVALAEKEYPCGTMNGWQIRTDPQRLAGFPSRNPCAQDATHTHITLDA